MSNRTANNLKEYLSIIITPPKFFLIAVSGYHKSGFVAPRTLSRLNAKRFSLLCTLNAKKKFIWENKWDSTIKESQINSSSKTYDKIWNQYFDILASNNFQSSIVSYIVIPQGLRQQIPNFCNTILIGRVSGKK